MKTNHSKTVSVTFPGHEAEDLQPAPPISANYKNLPEAKRLAAAKGWDWVEALVQRHNAGWNFVNGKEPSPQSKPE